MNGHFNLLKDCLPFGQHKDREWYDFWCNDMNLLPFFCRAASPQNNHYSLLMNVNLNPHQINVQLDSSFFHAPDAALPFHAVPKLHPCHSPLFAPYIVFIPYDAQGTSLSPVLTSTLHPCQSLLLPKCHWAGLAERKLQWIFIRMWFGFQLCVRLVHPPSFHFVVGVFWFWEKLRECSRKVVGTSRGYWELGENWCGRSGRPGAWFTSVSTSWNAYIIGKQL